MRDRQRRESDTGDVGGQGTGAPGKQSLVERAYAGGGGAAPPSDVAPVQLKAAPHPDISDDPYGAHLLDAPDTPENRAKAKEIEYRMLVGDEFYEQTKHMSWAQRKATIREEAFRQQVGDELYEEMRDMSWAERKAHIQKMADEQMGKKPKKGAKKKPPPKAPPPPKSDEDHGWEPSDPIC
jgi:hypothetical protein